MGYTIQHTPGFGGAYWELTGNGYGRGGVKSGGDGITAEQPGCFTCCITNPVGSGRGRCSSRFGSCANESGHGRTLETIYATGGEGCISNRVFRRIMDDHYGDLDAWTEG